MIWFRRFPTWPLVALLIVDTGMLILDLRHDGTGPWSIGASWGYANTLEYGKITIVVVLLWRLWHTTREAMYAAWTAIFAIVLAVDASMFHSYISRLWIRHIDPTGPLGLPRATPGELLVWIAAGAVAVGVLAAVLRGAHTTPRAICLGYSGLMVLLGLFVIVVDTWTGTLSGDHHHHGELVEETGELMTLSLILGFTLVLWADPSVRNPDRRRGDEEHNGAPPRA